MYSFYILFIFKLCVTGLPHGQEKSGKTKKNDKSQVKMGVFEKSQENLLKNI